MRIAILNRETKGVIVEHLARVGWAALILFLSLIVPPIWLALVLGVEALYLFSRHLNLQISSYLLDAIKNKTPCEGGEVVGERQVEQIDKEEMYGELEHDSKVGENEFGHQEDKANELEPGDEIEVEVGGVEEYEARSDYEEFKTGLATMLAGIGLHIVIIIMGLLAAYALCELLMVVGKLIDETNFDENYFDVFVLIGLYIIGSIVAGALHIFIQKKRPLRAGRIAFLGHGAFWIVVIGCYIAFALDGVVPKEIGDSAIKYPAGAHEAKQRYTMPLASFILTLHWIFSLTAAIVDHNWKGKRIWKKVSANNSWLGMVVGTVLVIGLIILCLPYCPDESLSDMKIWITTGVFIGVFGTAGQLLCAKAKWLADVERTSIVKMPGIRGLWDSIAGLVFASFPIFILWSSHFNAYYQQ